MQEVRRRAGHALAGWALGSKLLLLAAMICGGTLYLTDTAHATLLGAPEVDSWSDMAFPSGVSGGYDSGTLSFTVSAAPSNDLEIGSEYGPSNNGKHYGSTGTLGGAFSTTLSVSGVEILSDGTINNGGTLSIVYNGGVPGSLGDDYGITGGDALLTGTVVGVLLDATGDDTLDVEFAISGGALQTGTNSEPSLAGIPFSTNGRGLLRIAGTPLPSDFNSTFSFTTSTTIDVFGLPEPSSLVLALFGMIAALTLRGKRRTAAL